MTKKNINETVAVSAYWFDRNFEPVPKRIEFEGRTIMFIDRGLRYCIKRGNQITRLFDLTDGEALFRLRQEVDSNAWDLLSISR